MKVIEKKKDSIIRFEDVPNGEIFESRGLYWMKVFNMLKDEYYVVCITDGEVCDEFRPGDKCRVVNAELHILD